MGTNLQKMIADIDLPVIKAFRVNENFDYSTLDTIIKTAHSYLILSIKMNLAEPVNNLIGKIFQAK